MNVKAEIKRQARELREKVEEEIQVLTRLSDSLAELRDIDDTVLEPSVEVQEEDFTKLPIVVHPKPKKRYNVSKTRSKHHIRKCQDRLCKRNFKGYKTQKFCCHPHGDREGLKLRMERRSKGDYSEQPHGRVPALKPEPKKKAYPKHCSNCSREFLSKAPNGKYCTAKCHTEALQLRWASQNKNKPTILLRGDNASQ